MTSESKTKSKLETKEQREVIDDCFYVWENRMGLWCTETLEGRKMLTGLTKDVAVSMTRWHLKCEQEGTLEKYSRIVGSAIVGGKL